MLAEIHLLPILSIYMQRYPAVDIELLTEERMPHFKEEQVDLAFGVNWPAPDEIVARQIGETRYVLCASPEYILKQGTPLSLKDLSQHLYIPHLGRKLQTPIVSLKESAQAIPSLQSPFKVSNTQLLKACALKGLGIVQLHEYVVAEELRAGKLIALLPDVLKEKEPLFIYYQKNRFVQPKLRSLVNLILESQLCSVGEQVIQKFK